MANGNYDDIIAQGYTMKEIKECLDELIKKGIAKGVFQDYGLLNLIVIKMYSGVKL